MAEIVKAVYEKGALYLLQPLDLQERQTVRIQVVPEEVVDEVEEVIQTLVAAGLMRPPPVQRRSPPPDPVSQEKRRELAEILGKAPGKPLSEIIIEERGEW